MIIGVIYQLVMIVRRGVPARDKFTQWISFETTQSANRKVCAAYVILSTISEDTKEHVNRILREANQVFLLTTLSPPTLPKWIHGSIINLSLQLSWLDFTPDIKPPEYNNQFFVENFDISYKRNYAIVHARRQSFQNILLIDDDIIFRRGMATRALQVLEKGFEGYGTYSLYHPDKSAVDLWALSESGDTPEVGISGNCIFLDVKANLPRFPLVYNEDWIFFQTCVELRNLRLFGGENVVQKPPRAKSEQLVAFQQFGEVLVDCIFYRQTPKQPTLTNILQQDVVRAVIRRHIERLSRLTYPWDSLEAAMDALESMSVTDVVQYGHSLIETMNTSEDLERGYENI